MTRSARTFTVRYELDDRDTWIVDVIEEPSVHGRGRTLATAERSIRTALARRLSAEEGERVNAGDLTLQPQFTFAEAGIVGRVTRQREVARRAEADAETLTTEAAHQLVGGRMLNLRDAAHLLGISQVHIKRLLGSATTQPAT